MENNSCSTEDNDSLDIASKYWKRVVDIATKTGYKKGIQDGQDSILQHSFDMGYKDGFETAFMLGKYKSLSIAQNIESIKHPVDIVAILDKTKQGTCWICMESQTSDIFWDTLFLEVLNNQRIHITEIINRLSKYFQLALKKSSSKIGLSL